MADVIDWCCCLGVVGMGSLTFLTLLWERHSSCFRAEVPVLYSARQLLPS